LGWEGGAGQRSMSNEPDEKTKRPAEPERVSGGSFLPPGFKKVTSASSGETITIIGAPRPLQKPSQEDPNENNS
jgi:hypothetical protein